MIEVIDADPAARDKTVKVKVAAPAQPVLPPAQPGLPFIPVEFAGLTVTPYVNQAGRLAYSLKAAGVRPPSAGPRGADGKDAAAWQRRQFVRQCPGCMWARTGGVRCSTYLGQHARSSPSTRAARR